MTTELLILRHGKSDWNLGEADFQRPITDRGKRGAQRMGIWLWQQDLLPDHIISSPAERALVTTEKACKAMGMDPKTIHKDQRIYEAGLSALLSVLHECPTQARRVMLVGHNPGLEMLLLHLSNKPIDNPADGKLLPTATLARLTMPDDWSQLQAGCAEVISITRPGSLQERFPYPAPHGDELRDRPAYYYSQSSVIPYRMHKGKPQILVILSSKKKHFVVPKGIKEPGLSPRESAAQEAWEEAGVEGDIGDTALGSYRYQKWGATCTVKVYPMRVTREIPEHEWEESHRGRQWVTPKQAAKRLKQAELAPLVKALAKQLGASSET